MRTAEKTKLFFFPRSCRRLFFTLLPSSLLFVFFLVVFASLGVWDLNGAVSSLPSKVPEELKPAVFHPLLPSLGPGKRIGQYVFDTWGVREGLPSESVWGIGQTADGYIWMATHGGVVRFNGVSFKTFNRENTPVLTTNRISNLLVARDHSIWVGNANDGVCRYRNGRFEKYSREQGLNDDQIQALFQDEKGDIWVGGSTGIFRFQGQGFQRLNPGGKSMRVTAIHEDMDGAVWFAHRDAGVYRYKDGEFTLFTTAHGLSGLDINDMCLDKRGRLLVGTDHNGLNRFENGRFAPVQALARVFKGVIWRLYRDRAGTVWLGTDSGLGFLRGDDVDFFSTEGGLVDKRIRSFFEDREGNLWVGVYKGGVLRFKDGCIATVGKNEGLSDSFTWSAYRTGDGAVWIGTEKGGANRLKDGNVTVFTTRQGLSSNQVQCFLEDGAGNLWIGTDRGVDRMAAGSVAEHFSTTHDGNINLTRCLFQSPFLPGTIWVGTRKRGLHVIEDGKIRQYPLPSSCNSASVSHIVEAARQPGIFWLATERGLLRLRVESGESRLFTIEDGLGVNWIAHLYIDSGGTIWIGTVGGGLARFRDGRIFSYNTNDGLLDDGIWSVYEDRRQHLWMSCDRGIFYVDKKQLNDYAAARQGGAATDGADAAPGRIVTTVFGVKDGMKSTECNGGGNPYLLEPDGNGIWYPTAAGIAQLDFRRLKNSIVPPPVYIETVRIDQREYTHDAPAVLSAGNRDIEFHFTALNYRNPEGVTFKYKLEGYRDQWLETGTRRAAYYTNLSPGHYRFRVIAANSEGLWNEVGAAHAFYLEPCFYQTWWFLVSVCLGVAGLIGLGVHFRLAGINARNRQLQNEIDERKRAESELTHLQKLLTNIIDSMPSVLIGVDGAARVTHWNARTAQLTGLAAAEVVGRSVQDVYPLFSSQLPDLERTLKEGKPLQGKKTIRKIGNETRFSSVSIYPLPVNGVDGAVIRIDDITELETKEAQLRQAQKMETVGTLASGLAHDFNNILGGIIGTLTLTRFKLEQTGGVPAEELDEYLGMMEECGERATNMVRQLLTLSRQQDLSFAPVDLNSTIKHVMKICRNSLHKSVILNPLYLDEPAMVKADPVQLEQVLLNFCVNADHSMTIMKPPRETWGGPLSVTIESVYADSHFRQLHPEAEDRRYWNLSVKDEGVGMDNETAAKIFNPFFTRKEKGAGTGLGLSMAYNIVRRHGGFISFFSREGYGTTFNIYLPLLEGELEEAGEAKNREAGVACGDGMILVVDDERIMRQVARSILTTCGYKVILAENGQESVEIFQKRHREIDLVLLDMAMPQLSGKDAFERMLKIDPNVKVLLASGFKQDVRIRELFDLGLKGFIQKPFTLKKLADAVDKIIHGETIPFVIDTPPTGIE